jgi:hypothetical protein
VALTLTTLPLGSKAKFCGAVIVLPDVVHVDVSSSAMKASLYCWPTNSGNSSERNRKLKLRQFDPAGTFNPIRRIETSRSVSPRTLAPPSWVLAGVDWAPSIPDELPVVMIAKVGPFVGKPPSGEFAVA